MPQPDTAEISPNLLRSFSEELQKEGALTPGDKVKILASLGIGAATALGGKRIFDDVQMAERMRRGGGGYY